MRKLVPLTAVAIVLGFAGNGWGQQSSPASPSAATPTQIICIGTPLHRIHSQRLRAKRESERRKSTKPRGSSPTTICPRRGEFRR